MIANTRTLLVEDNDLLRKSVTQSLEHFGCHVTAVSGGTAAREAIDSGGTFDVLFADIRMPDSFDGLQLARWVRSRDLNIGVVLTSGFHDEVVEPDFQFLAKPFTVEELRNAIARAKPGATESDSSAADQ